MDEYDFTFVVEGATVEDPVAVDLLETELDAMLSRGGGVDLLDIPFRGLGAVDAALMGAREAEKLVPGLRVLRVDRDLVGVAEIAERADVSRQNVHQWIKGERRPGAPFPTPEGTAGRSQIWLWSEVDAWLVSIGKDDGLRHPTRDEMAVIDSALHAGLVHLAEPALRRWLEFNQQGHVPPSAAGASTRQVTVIQTGQFGTSSLRMGTALSFTDYAWKPGWEIDVHVVDHTATIQTQTEHPIEA